MTDEGGGLERALGSPVVARRSVAGGSINAAERIELDDGRLVFAKSRDGADLDEFEAEAAGLRWLAEPGVVNVPKTLAVSDDPPTLALEWIEPGLLSSTGAEGLGRGLAEMHLSGAGAFGTLPPRPGGAAAGPPRIGSLELVVNERDSWGEVYAHDRLLPAKAIAAERGAISASGVTAVERVCERIDDLCGPAEPPARLHGDIWSGNVMADQEGEAWLVDPVAYGGHREVDLAMLRLFGAPSQRIFSAYEERAPLAEGHAERVELWQLFPLLVHAALVGGAYGDSATRVAERYA
ncbi:fructosamine kinase family protein [soil metagenome]